MELTKFIKKALILIYKDETFLSLNNLLKYDGSLKGTNQ